MHPTTTVTRGRIAASAASKHKRTRIPSVAAWASATLGFLPDSRQRRLLNSTSPRAIVCACRQWGKTTLAAIRALHHSTFHPGSLVLIVSPALRHSAELLRKIRRFRRIPGDKSLDLHFANGSRILTLPPSASSVRGFSADFVILDDAASLPDEVFHAAIPTLASTSGRLWVLSAPRYPAGFFHALCSRRHPGWVRLRTAAHQCPRISTRHLKEARLRLGDPDFRRDYLCQFVEPGGRLLLPHLIERAFE